MEGPPIPKAFAGEDITVLQRLAKIPKRPAKALAHKSVRVVGASVTPALDLHIPAVAVAQRAMVRSASSATVST